MLQLEEQEIEKQLKQYIGDSEQYGLSVDYEEDILTVAVTYDIDDKPSTTAALDQLLEDETVEVEVDSRPSKLCESWREDIYSIWVKE